MEIFGRLLGGLILVLALIGVSAYIYSRLTGIKLKGEEGFIKVVATRLLGPKKTITVVQIGNEYLVLGITSEQITCLARMGKTNEQNSKDKSVVQTLPEVE